MNKLEAAVAGREVGGLEKLTTLLKYPEFLIGFTASGLLLGLYTLTLKYFDVSIAYPIVTSGALVLVFAVGVIHLDESVSAVKIAGLTLILLGVLLLSSAAR